MISSVEYISLLIIPLFILFTVLYGTLKKVKVYDSFVAGAKEGPAIVLNIFPYLLTIFVAIKGFQASGAFDYVRDAFYSVFAFLEIPIEAISMAIVKPLSGSASVWDRMISPFSRSDAWIPAKASASSSRRRRWS